jgi:hypothetical protein
MTQVSDHTATSNQEKKQMTVKPNVPEDAHIRPKH